MSHGIHLVTGGNRGLGLETCRQLAAQGARVLLTARSREKAGEAARKVAEGGGELEGTVLDVTDPDGPEDLKRQLEQRGDSLAALVNNAGIALDGFDERVAARTLETNLEGPMRVTDALLPLLEEHGRVVNVSSGAGRLSILSPSLRERLCDAALTREGLRALARSFVEAVRAGRHGQEGWPSSAYGVSKACLNAYTRILARDLEDDPRGLRVNSVSPGWVRTDMGGSSAPRAPEEGAKGIVWAATLPPDGPSGGFFQDGRPIEW